MNATRNNRIIGTSVAGVGMAITMFAGTALGACPPDGKDTVRQGQPVARTSQTRCARACCAGGNATARTTATGSKNARKQVTRERRVIVRGGPEGIRLGDMSFGDLEFDGDVLAQPEGKKRRLIKRLERDDDDRTIRFEIRIVGPDGEEHGFSFGGDDRDGDDRDGRPHRFGPLSFSLEGDGFNRIGDRSFVVGVQPQESDEIWFGPDDDAHFKTESRIFFKQQTGDDTITIEITNGKVSATINGKKVPPSRIRREHGKVSILNEDGEVVATVPMAMGGGEFVIGEPGLRLFGESFEQAETPPVMLGIQMAPVDEDTAEALDLDEGEGILILGVIDDLPAAEAGLQEHDVILRIKGAGVATQEKLRDVLLDKEPGDEITFKVARGDDIKEIEVELEAYDADELGIPLKDFDEPEAFRFRVPGPAGGFLDDRAIERYMDKLREFDFDEEAMDEAREAFEDAIEQMRKGLPRFNYRTWRAPDDEDWTILHGEEPDNVFALAPRRAARDTDIKKELAELKEQLAEVQRQREELTDELAEIKALLKKLAGRSDRD